MTTVFAFIFMFGLLVFIHEFGHLIFAKRAGMLVREFAIGFGPKVFDFMKDETVYTIRLLPIGGYVRVAGEDPEIIELKPGHHVGLEFNDDGRVKNIIVNNKSKHPNIRIVEVERVDLDHDLVIEAYDIGEYDEKYTFDVDRKAFFIMDEVKTQIAPYDRQFASKSVGKRAMQLFAGPMMNFILALIIFCIIGLVHGVPMKAPVISEVVDDTPAKVAGLQSGDKVVQINGEQISTWNEFTGIIEKNGDKELDVTVDRDGTTETLAVTPAKVEVQKDVFIGQVGVMQSTEKSLVRSFTHGFYQTYDITKLVLTNLAMLITGQYSIDMLSGPVGIYDATNQVVQTGFSNFMMWTAMLSVNLGIINLVPLPALDGGRLMFVGLEAVRGKPLDPQKEGLVHFIGFALIMLLMIVVTWNDIQRLFL